MSDAILSGVLGRKASPKSLAVFLISLPILALISYILLNGTMAADAEHPGGQFFETAFWITSFGSAFLSYFMIEVLFRSRETQILAPWPVDPGVLFRFQMKRVLRGIGLSSVPWAAFWSPHLFTEPAVAALCIALWIVGLSVSAFVASAVILYSGKMGTKEKTSASFGANAFSFAPAVSLVISLMAILFLKLLAEALLKPNFAGAAMTAGAIIAVITTISLLYAAITYRKQYYAILAAFMDTDLIVLDAGYAFVDNKQAVALRSSQTALDALRSAYILQFRRRSSLSSILVVVFAIVFFFVLNHSQDMSPAYVLLIAQIPWILFSRPWAILTGQDISTAMMDHLPVEPQKAKIIRLQACFRILPMHGGMLAAAIFLSYALNDRLFPAIFTSIGSFLLSAVVTIVGWCVFEKKFSRLQ